MPDRQEIHDIKSYYGDYWTENGPCPEGSPWPGLERLLAATLPQNAAVLDVGCGDGLTAGRFIVSRKCKYVGVDISGEAVELAKRNGFEAYCVYDAGELPFSDNQFDAAVCIEVLEHLFLPHLAVQQILRVLKPGGVLVAIVPNAAHWRRRLELGFAGLFNPYGQGRSSSQPWCDPHIRFFTPRSLKRMLEVAGYENVTSGGTSTVPVRDLQRMSGVNWAYWRLHGTSVYSVAERIFPSVFSIRAHAVAYKPMAESPVSLERGS